MLIHCTHFYETQKGKIQTLKDFKADYVISITSFVYLSTLAMNETA